MARRVEVEGYLSRHPEAASRVMADLLVRDELRLAMPATPFTAGTLEAARRLQRGLFWGQVTHRLRRIAAVAVFVGVGWRSEEHTSELQSLMRISYAVFCLKKKKREINTTKEKMKMQSN